MGPQNGMSNTPFDDFTGYDALGLAELIRNKGVSPTELVELHTGSTERLGEVVGDTHRFVAFHQI